ncbi:MAG TPA: TIGR04211 family SH3 domain-containing protein [Gammaproteobacteria bacterium]|nr:TIGR04211 family SH3 domain-containing protein [Gammaproteobacteria bacterium]
MKKLLLIISLSIVFGASWAETRYVSDQFEITMRTGKSSQNQIKRVLKSGTALIVIRVDKESGYTNVRTEGGTEGWVLSRYLMKSPPARQQLIAAKSKITKLEKTVVELRSQLNTTSSDKKQALAERNKLSKQNTRVGHELARIKKVSANAIRLAQENEELKLSTDKAKREIQMLRQEYESLDDRSKRDWFIVGAIVVVFSMLFGILLTRIRWKRKTSWSDL